MDNFIHCFEQPGPDYQENLYQSQHYDKILIHLDRRTLEKIYLTFIRSLLEYGDVV